MSACAIPARLQLPRRRLYKPSTAAKRHGIQCSKRAALLELIRRRAPKDIETCARLLWPTVNPGRPLKWSWHMSALCEHLAAWISGEIPRVIINVPPGHSKSFLVSCVAPVWAWLTRPELRLIAASYDMTLSQKLNIQRRTAMESKQHALAEHDWEPAKGEWDKRYIVNNYRGFMRAVSTSSGVTGDHADLMIVDDPIKPTDVWGPALKDHVEWFNETASTRFGDLMSARIAIVMQRIHDDDLTGHLVKEDDKREARGQPRLWAHVCLPAEFAPERRASTPIGWQDPRTVEGELLCPSRFPAEIIEYMKIKLGSAGYAAQYQQDPTVGQGRMLNSAWWRKWSPGPDGGLPGKVDAWVGSIDATFGETENDFVVVHIWARIGNKAYLVQEYRDRWEFTDLVNFMVGEPSEDGRGYRGGITSQWPQVRRWLVERAANGAALVSRLKRALGAGSTVISVVPTESKQARAAACAPLIESGHVLIPEQGEWVADFVDECSKFPNTTHNDRVDAMTQAVTDMGGTIGIASFKPAVAERPAEFKAATQRWGAPGTMR